MKRPVNPGLVRRFEGIPITQKALREVERTIDLHRRGLDLALATIREELKASVPRETRTAAYNAGYTRALFDLLEAQDTGGFRAWTIDGRHVVPGEDGRLHLEPRQ